MEMMESQRKKIWEAIGHWISTSHVTQRNFSLHIGYSFNSIMRGLKDGAEPITSELLQKCVIAFSLTSARERRGSGDNLTDEERIELLTAYQKESNGQGKFQL
jgi:hypothetical protein